MFPLSMTATANARARTPLNTTLGMSSTTRTQTQTQTRSRSRTFSLICSFAHLHCQKSTHSTTKARQVSAPAPATANTKRPQEVRMQAPRRAKRSDDEAEGAEEVEHQEQHQHDEATDETNGDQLKLGICCIPEEDAEEKEVDAMNHSASKTSKLNQVELKNPLRRSRSKQVRPETTRPPPTRPSANSIVLPYPRPKTKVRGSSVWPPARTRIATTRSSPDAIMLTASVLLLLATIATCYSFSVTSAQDAPRRPARDIGGEEAPPGGHLSSSSSLPAETRARLGARSGGQEEGRTSTGPARGAQRAHATQSGALGAGHSQAHTTTSSLTRRHKRGSQSSPSPIQKSGLAVGARQRPSSSPGGLTSPTGAGVRGTPSSGEQAARQQHQTSSSAVDLREQQASRSIKNVTAQNGQSVLLHCLVEPNESGELPEVSWFRGTGEPQLLTYELMTIIKDERFFVRQGVSRLNDWALQIKNLDRQTDAGLYQCQTSGDSPQLQSYQLNIVDPQVGILGSPDLAVKVGAPINLTCVISQSADQMQFVFWYRDARMINYDFPQESRGKIVLSKAGQRQDTLSSNLQIFQSRLSDSGNYTCAPSGARSTSIYVHVLEANDKRLIMFQNDGTNPFAASSHQTNSAISSHMVRLSRGRAYATIVGFFILASWFQLVAQVQTATSLVLVAIIGLFLSHTTDRQRARAKRPQQLGADDGGPRQTGRLLKSSGTRPAVRVGDKTPSSASLDQEDDEDDEQRDEQLECRDPLLHRANDALNLLRTLNDPDRLEKSSSSSSMGKLDDEDEFRSLSFGALEGRRRGRGEHKIRPTTRLLTTTGGPQEPQTSPGGSSAASTGYNSDSHNSAPSKGPNSGLGKLRTASSPATPTTPSVSLLEAGPEFEVALDEATELEMIELLRGRPTAMRLVIETLRRSSGCQLETAEESKSTRTRAESVGRVGCCENGGQRRGDANEQVYSVPAIRLADSNNSNKHPEPRHRDEDEAQTQLERRL